MNYDNKALEQHKKHRGKIEIKSKTPLTNKDELSIAYTPGVGAVSTAIGQDKTKSWELTNRASQVAVVSDGTAILGLGNLGPEAAMPVMEGKAAIFKTFANIDGIPLCINTTDVDEIVQFCKHIEPSFAGINLEDISAPRCFEILDRLQEELSIPVFHDDQDGTAIVALAALTNALKITNKPREELTIVINGAGAAGIAIARLLNAYGITNVFLCDSKGVINKTRTDLNTPKQQVLEYINSNNTLKALAEAMQNADVFMGVSVGNVVKEEMIKSMNQDPIIFAMANPTPEIMPDKARAAGAAIVGTGRSDFPNQINNALVFPGLFKGLLDNNIKHVTVDMKLAAAQALADVIEPTAENLLPAITDKAVVTAIASSFQ